MGLRDIESRLPPGFKFHPSDEELVCHYLTKKVANEKISGGTLVEVDLHIREPWELPEMAKLNANNWYFFSFRDRKYSTGSRTNRATKTGYWKATGKDRTIYDPCTRSMVGMRKTLVFYCGRAPNGMKTAWVMHEFRLETPYSPPKEDWVLCRVFHQRKAETKAVMNIYNNNTNTENYNRYGQQEMSCSPSITSNVISKNYNSAAANVSNQQQEDHVICSNSFQYSSFLDFFPQEVDSSSSKFEEDSYEFLLEPWN